jgi:hypothetical protein
MDKNTAKPVLDPLSDDSLGPLNIADRFYALRDALRAALDRLQKLEKNHERG